MAVLNFLKLDGTQNSAFQLDAVTGGVKIKDVAGNLAVRNAGDTADATVTGSEFLASGDTGLVINSNATATGADWSFTLSRPATGMTSNLSWTLPSTAGTSGFVLSTDGAGNLSWVASSSGATDTTVQIPLAFGSAATVSVMTLPANAVIESLEMVVDTAFDGTPTASVGTTTNNSKYMGSGDMNLNVAAGWSVNPNVAADTASEALNIYYTAGGATVGAARLLLTYSIPV